MEELDFLKRIRNEYQETIKLLKQAGVSLNESFLKVFEQPAEVHTRRFFVDLENGKPEVFTGYRSRHFIWEEPTKGGIRFSPEVTEDVINALAWEMSFKVGLFDLGYGGAKGGVTLNPKDYTERQLENICKAYAHAFGDVFGPYKDVPAGDIGVGSREVGWMVTQWTDDHADVIDKYATFTGKPLSLHGSVVRSGATAQGGCYVLEEALRRGDLPFDTLVGKKYLIMGAGKAGGGMATRVVEQLEGIVCGISDSRGGIYNPEGIDVNAALAYKAQNSSFVGYEEEGLTYFPFDKNELTGGKTKAIFLGQEADILVPAAAENQITYEVAQAIKAKALVELANSPTTDGAEEILLGKGVYIAPDLLANGGGVSASYIEWSHNTGGLATKFQDVNEDLGFLRKIMDIGYENASETMEKFNLPTLRKGAMAYSILKFQEIANTSGLLN